MAQIRIKDIYVNREQEVALFKEMLEGKIDQHILLLKADAGMGKTTLMLKLFDVAHQYPRAYLSLKGLNETWRVLERLASQFGRQKFESFYSQLSTISHVKVQVEVSDTKFGLGSRTTIDARGGEISQKHLEMQEEVLIVSFFNDLEVLHRSTNQRIVFLLDTYDQATDKIKEWISISLLNQIRNLPWLVTVIAGRQIPDIEAILHASSIKYTLEALDKKSCGEFVERVGLTLNDDEIALIYSGTDGIPLFFASFMENYTKGAKDG